MWFNSMPISRRPQVNILTYFNRQLGRVHRNNSMFKEIQRIRTKLRKLQNKNDVFEPVFNL